MYKVYLKKATHDEQVLLETDCKESAMSLAITYHDIIKSMGEYVIPYTCVRIENENKVIYQAGSM